MSERADSRWVYGLDDGSAKMRELLGNKGANLAEMTRVLGAERVPGGFTITTAACVGYMRTGAPPPDMFDQVESALSALEEESGRRFGDPADPLLLSVRSGAPASMPGMLDTILNLGLNAESVEGQARAAGDERFAWDSRRRLVQMFSGVVRGLPADGFERALTETRREHGVKLDSDLSAEALRALAESFAATFTEHTGEPFPEDPREQLRQAIVAVFDSWNNERAITYRRLNGLPDELGTAVTVQRMVFGNLGEGSGSGVAFSRDPTSGVPEPDGDFLVNAQGEDVVAGVRNTEDLDGLARRMPGPHSELIKAMKRLEAHFRDIQDVEFTIERGRLYILQTRSAKRHARAGVRFAVDAVAEGLVGREAALMTIDPATLDALLHPAFAPDADFTELTRGVAASPGAAKGAIVFEASEAEARAADGEDVVLVRPFTSADDVGGFHAARGILTSQGGKSSHAAIVARGMGRPCVCGASEMEVDLERGLMRIGDRDLQEGERIVIDGASGVVTADDVELVTPEPDESFATILEWSDDIRRLGVRANADSGHDAARARELGAEGVGLCRTEHMFFGPDREAKVREMFISGELSRRGEPGAKERFEEALARLAEMQEGDFAEILEAMAGLPVTIRLLDPPMHEFLSEEAFRREIDEAEAAGDGAVAERARKALHVAGELAEANPMLGTRGARLGILLPELYEMQVRAIARAASGVASGEAGEIEIMIPLVTYSGELQELRALVERILTEELGGDERPELTIGSMIELPRACLVAGELAEHADFFSFGTNDLTQTTLGFSRDDVEREFLPAYLRRGLIPRSPFETIDEPGVGELVSAAAERGRAAKPSLRLGICGEHGGDPESIGFFHRAGLDYVSCSPFRVPLARVAAARAAIESS